MAVEAERVMKAVIDGMFAADAPLLHRDKDLGFAVTREHLNDLLGIGAQPERYERERALLEQDPESEQVVIDAVVRRVLAEVEARHDLADVARAIGAEIEFLPPERA